MGKLLKYLKKSIGPILLILVLLIIQALCDLALPDYTSNIVNIGIQQGGIESAVPEVIRANEMDKILLFVSDNDKEYILDNYKLINSESLNNDELKEYEKNYPAIKEESLYKLDIEDKEKMDKLESIFAKPMLIVSGFEQDSDEVKSMKENIINNLPPQMAQGEDVNIFEVFSMMSAEQLNQITSNMNEQFDAMPESILDQAAISYLKGEYESIGMDVDKNQTNYIFLAGAKMLGIALISAVMAIAVGFIASKIAAKTSKELRSNVFKKVMSFSSAEMDKFSTASLITRSTNDIQQIQMVTVMLLRMVLYAPILGIGGIFKVLSTETSMTWIIALAVGVIMVIVLILFLTVMPKFKMVQKLVDRVNLVAREIITGIPVIRAFSTQKHEEERFDVANKDLTKVNLFVNRVMSGMMPLMMFIMNGVTLLIVWNGAKGVDAGSMQVGDMMAFIQYAMQIIMSFLMITMVSIMLPRAAVSAVRIDEILTTEPTIKDSENIANFDNSKNGLVEFNNVSFRYPDADEDVLTNISFTAKPGETTAFIGSTGSGKSTLINLIPRFFDVTNGEILVDGADIRNVSQYELREKIGYVPQKGVLFSGTIESNIKYGKENATLQEIEKAAEIAQATEFISNKPERFETQISQGGTNVSGGQKQRLSIARAIAKNPEIYIFDDSFSALDFKTDAVLRKALKKETGDSTVLIVAQRISTILHAEQIIVLDEGKIVGKGTHKELLSSCEVYKQIALSQLSKEELENE